MIILNSVVSSSMYTDTFLNEGVLTPQFQQHQNKIMKLAIMKL